MTSIAARSFEAVAPDDYLQLAGEWAQLDNPAGRRSAVDRAYYAAFLAARGQLTAKGYGSFAASPQAHGQVQDAVWSVDPEIGRRLLILRRARNRLTYETGLIRLPRRQSLPRLLDYARAIIAAVEELPSI